MSHNQAGAWLSTARAISMQPSGGARTTIYKFAPNGSRTAFVGPTAFAPGEYPVGLAFDSSGNLFVSIETFTDPGADSIVYFTPSGMGTTFATGLTFPRGLAFDSLGNLFVAEANAIPEGDILKFTPGGVRSTFLPPASAAPNSSPSGPRDNRPCSLRRAAIFRNAAQNLSSRHRSQGTSCPAAT